MADAAAAAAAPPAATPLADRLDALSQPDLEQLRAEWREQYRTSPPPRLSRDLLQRALAHRLQEAALGGLAAATRRKLASLAQALATEGGVRAAPVLRLKPGAMLVREWHGHSHTVLVLEDGFEHAGQRYASLSHIARVITGAHWSGPRFFGLCRSPRPSRTRPGRGKQEGRAPEHA